MAEQIRFHKISQVGMDAMSANTARSFPRHTHDQYGIGVIDSGGHASLSGRGQVEAGPGSLIFVNPGEVHDGRPIAGSPRSWRILYFDPRLLEEVCTDIDDGARACVDFTRPVFVDEPLRHLFNSAFAQITAHSQSAMACETAILLMVARARLNTTPKGRAPGETAADIRRVLEMIEADPASSELTLARLAREVHLSRYQLLRGFTRALGLTPHAYILQQRLALARRLLRAGHSLAGAALESGFCDQSHLTHCFARQVGVTPRRYASRGA